MSGSPEALVQLLPGPARRSPRPWVESPAFDLSFFLLAPLLTLPLVFGIMAGVSRLATVGFLLAFAHYLSTFAFFFWDESRAEHRARWVAFFVGPLVIVAVFWALVVFEIPLFIPFVLFFWNALHVSFQSCGIASIYRHRAGVFDRTQKPLANHAIILTGLWMALWNIETHEQVWPVLTWVSPAFPAVLRGVLGAVALLAVVRLGMGLRRRAQAGQPADALEIGILLTGLTLFHPYLWMNDSEGATFVMLLPHYVQYLGIVWLVHRRRFTQVEGSLAQRGLAQVSRNLVLLTGVLLSGGLAFLAGKVLFRSIGHVEQFEVLYLMLAFVHFYLDGLFWAFRDPHVRRTVGPYLMRGSRSAPAAPAVPAGAPAA
jgi:hypothetical protein